MKKTALITGASSGLGTAFAKEAAALYDTILVARSKDKLETLSTDLKKQYGGSHSVLKADLTNRKELEIVAKRIMAEPELDLLVNNAGFGTIGDFANLESSKEMNQIDLNVVALTRLSHAALQVMRKRKSGRIINVASMAAFLSAPYNATYSASKIFVKSFSEALFEENRDFGIYIQALCPGFTRTGFQEKAELDSSKIPEFFWMEPAEVAQISLQEKQKPTVIPGLLNRSGIFMGSFIPDDLRRNLTGRLMQNI